MDELAIERNAIAQLEIARVHSGFSMLDLESCFQHAKSPITRILVASIIVRALCGDENIADVDGDSFENIANEVSGMAECDELCQSCDSELVSNSVVPLKEVVSWAARYNNSIEEARILCRFSKILETVRHDYEYPCDPRLYEGNGFATWAELRVAAHKFMTTRHPKLSDCLELILFLRKRPFLNMTVNTKPSTASGMMEQEDDISVFDSKMDMLRLKYPVIDKVTDPVLVIIESIGGAPTLPQPDAILATMASANVVPVILPEPRGSTFSHAFQTANIQEARTFAEILRVAFVDSPTRILVVNSPATAFRVL